MRPSRTSTSSRRRGPVAVAAGLLLAVAVAPAAGAQADPTIRVRPTDPAVGTSVDVDGTDFPARARIEFFLDKFTDDERRLASDPENVRASDSRAGSFEAEVFLGRAPAGRHVLFACVAGTVDVCAQAGLTIRPASPTTTPSSTPTTRPATTTTASVPVGPPSTGVITPSTGAVTSTIPPGPSDLATSSTMGPEPTFDPNPSGLALTTTTTGPAYVPPNEVSGASLAITGVEVTQGVQDMDNSLAMVAGRWTVARVHVETDGPPTAVRGRAGLFRDGDLLATADADNQPVVATADGSDRVAVDSTLNFTLPAEWTVAGPATLSFFVYEVSTQFTFDNDEDITDNFADVSTQFFTADPLEIVFVPVHLHSGYDRDNDQVTWYPYDNAGDMVEIMAGMARYLPFADLDFWIWPGEVIPPGHVFLNEFDLDESTANQAGQASLPHVVMAAMRDDSDDFQDHRWYGTLPPSAGLTYSMWSSTAGPDDQGAPISWGGLASDGVSIGVMSTSTQAATPWRLRGAYIIGHELGHNYGLSHVDCAGTEEDGGSIDPDFPTPAPNCSMAEVDPEGFFGFDVYGPSIASAGAYEVIDNDPTASAPNQGWPLMGYSSPEWLDPYAYCLLQVAFQVPCLAFADLGGGLGGEAGAGGGAGAAGEGEGAHDHSSHAHTHAEGADADGDGLVDFRAPAPPTAADDHEEEIDVPTVAWTMVQADPVAGTGRFHRVAIRPDGVPDPAPDGDAGEVEVRLFDLDGDDVGGGPVSGASYLPHEVLEESTSGAAIAASRFGISIDGVQIASAKLFVGGELVDELVASPTPPSVEIDGLETDGIVGPGTLVRWSAADADGDPVVADVQFSDDGGDNWVSLGVGVVGGELEVPEGLLPATDDGVVRVRVTDGFHTTSATLAGLSVADGPPGPPLILSPRAGQQFRPYQPFTVHAQGQDATDRVVRSFGVSSDVVGALGTTTDGRLDVGGLPAGTHVLTVTMVDGGGASSSGTVEVEIVGEVLVGDPAATDALLAHASGELRLPEATPDDERADRWMPVALLLGAVALAGAVVAVRRAMTTGPDRTDPPAA